MKTISALIACLCVIALSGCSVTLGGEYAKPDGSRIGGSVSLHPIGGGK